MLAMGARKPCRFELSEAEDGLLLTYDDRGHHSQRWISRQQLLWITACCVAAAITGFLFLGASFYARSPTLSFRQVNGTTYQFTILQIADIHLGESEYTDWGPEQDRKTWKALDSFLRSERTVDLIVLSGDQLTANNVNANATTYYHQLARKLESYQVPWALIFGNHDDAPFEVNSNDDENGDKTAYPAKTSRRDLIKAIAGYQHSLTQEGPVDVFGVSNYWLEVGQRVSILLLDTGGGSLPQRFDETQRQWLQDTWPVQSRSDSDNMDKPVVVAFAHIPTEEFAYTSNDASNTAVCVGMAEDGLAPLQDADMGLVSTLAAAGVLFLAAGHNHGNDYCCRDSSRGDISLCFGRHSGYGGYGSWDRGARVYQLQYQEGEQENVSLTSWVRLESGEVVDRYGTGNQSGRI